MKLVVVVVPLVVVVVPLVVVVVPLVVVVVPLVVDEVGVVVPPEDVGVVEVEAESLQADISESAAKAAPPVVAPTLCKNCRRDTFSLEMLVFSVWIFFSSFRAIVTPQVYRVSNTLWLVLLIS